MDERIMLMNMLIKIGINKNKSMLISIEAGSSQCIVDLNYLMSIHVEEKLLEKVMGLISGFYAGSFYQLSSF